MPSLARALPSLARTVPSLARTVTSLARAVPSLARTVLKPSDLLSRGTRRPANLSPVAGANEMPTLWGTSRPANLY